MPNTACDADARRGRWGGRLARRCCWSAGLVGVAGRRRRVGGRARRCCPRRCGWWSRAGRSATALWANTVPTLQVTAVGFTVSLAVGVGDRDRRRLRAVAARGPDPAARGVPDAADRRDRPAVDHLVRLRAAAEGGRDRAGHVLPDRHRAHRGLRGHRPPGHQPAAQHGRVPAGRSSATCGCPARCRRSSRRCGSASPTRSPVRSSPSTSGATAGLGIFMQVQKNSFRTDLVLAAVVVTAAVLASRSSR